MKKRNRHGDPHAPADARWGKRGIALFLSAAMCLSMLPAVALADEPENVSTEAQTQQIEADESMQAGNTVHAAHAVCAEDGCTEHNAIADWKAWDSAVSADYLTTLPGEAGNYYLTEDVTLTDTWKPADGTVLCLNGHSLFGDFAGDVIRVGDSSTDSTFTLTDCKGTGDTYGQITHSSGKTGRGVYVDDSSTFNMYGGSISGNTVQDNGGGVYVNGSTFTMSGGIITGNMAEQAGGGVYVNSGSTFNMTGGRMTDNTANYRNTAGSYKGGGVCVNAGSFKIGGVASISANWSQVTTSMGMLPSVSRNYDGNVYLTNGGLLTVTSALKNELGVLADVPYRVASGTDDYTLTNEDLSKFKYEEKKPAEGVGFYLTDGDIWLSEGEPHIHSFRPIDNAQLWTPISTEEALRAATDGYYYLKNDITLSDTWEPAKNVYLCLNGHSIKCSAANTPVITVGTEEDSKYLKLTDCRTSDQAGTITHTETGSGTGVLVNRGTFYMRGGKIIGNHATESNMGGGVSLAGENTNFYMYDGEITGNSTTANGGGVYAAYGAEFRVYGSNVITITGNTANDKKNNVYLANNTSIWAEYLEDGSEIGVTTETAPTADAMVNIVELLGTHLDPDIFKPDDKQYIVREKNAVSGSDYFVLALHEQHHWQYTASGATITAECSACGASGGSITIKAPTDLTYDGSKKAVTVEPSADWQGSYDGITYEQQDGTESNAAPTAPGTYTAWLVTSSGVSASVSYTIAKGTPDSRGFWIYGGNSKKPYTGEPQSVVVGPYASNYNLGEVTAVRYYDSEGNQVENPINAGVYTVKFDVAENDYWYAANDLELTSSKFTIEKADYPFTHSMTMEVPAGVASEGIHVLMPELLSDAQYEQEVSWTLATKAGEADKTLFPNGAITWDADGKGFTFKTEAVPAGYSATMTFRISGGTNYNDYEFEVPVNVVEHVHAALPVTMQDWTYGDTPNEPQYTRPEGTTGTTITYAKKNAAGDYMDAGTSHLTSSGDAGEYRVTVVCETLTATYTGTADFIINKAAATVTAKNLSAYVNGTAPVLGEDSYTVSGLIGEDKLTTAPALKYVDADGKEIAPDMTKTGETIIRASGAENSNYVFTYVDGKLTVTTRPSSGGGSASTPTKTETTTNPDGSTTKTETKADGTVTSTTTHKDGSTTKTETKKDGSSTTEVKDVSGSTGTVSSDKNGQTSASATISEKAVADAKQSDEAVKIPAEVKAGESSTSAPTVKIDLPKNAGATKVEIPVKDVTSGTVAVIVKPDGTEEIVKNSIPTENGLELTVDGAVTVKIVDNAKDFADTKGHWAQDSIDFVSARGLVNGTSGSTFSPEEPTTRAQLWMMLARQADADTNGGATWYEKAQDWAKNAGVSDGSNPNGNISRAEMVTMLWRAAGSPVVNYAMNMTDVPADAYYTEAVRWALSTGITTGVGNSLFDPNSTCTRAQIATFLHRTYQAK